MPAGLPDHRSFDALALESFHASGSLAAASRPARCICWPCRDLGLQQVLDHGLRVREQELALLAASEAAPFEPRLVRFRRIEVPGRLECLNPEDDRLIDRHYIFSEEV